MLLAVGDLRRGVVPRDESLVAGRDLRDQLGVDSNSSDLRVGESESNGLVVGTLGELGGELGREGELSGLVDGSSTDGVEKNSEFLLHVVRRVLCENEMKRKRSEREIDRRDGRVGGRDSPLILMRELVMRASELYE